MSEFEDPSANTGRFRAFVESGAEEPGPARRLPASPGVLIAVGVAVVVLIIVVVAIA
jgi:hypothetical protein